MHVYINIFCEYGNPSKCRILITKNIVNESIHKNIKHIELVWCMLKILKEDN